MLKRIFGEIANGRLTRLPYLGYSVLLAALSVGFVVALGLMIGAGEQLIGGDLQQAQAKLAEWFTLPFMVVFGLVVALFVFAGANIMAKRIRDIGLPGWWSVLAIVVLTGVVSVAISAKASNGLYLLITLALLLIPSGAVAKGAREAHG
jgi:uncharacterized membrane protein YhaH (DUF805 family)